MLQAGIEVFRVLPDDDQVHVPKTGLDSRQIPDGAKIGVKPQPLSQADVDAGEPAGDGRGNGPLEGHPVLANGLQQAVGKVDSVALQGCSSGIDGLPLHVDAGRLNHFGGCLSDFRSNAVSGDQGDFVSQGCRFSSSLFNSSQLLGFHSRTRRRASPIWDGFIFPAN